MIRPTTAGNEKAYREEDRDLSVWCLDNNFSLKISKVKELIVDYRKQRAKHAPIHINRAVEERVESFKFLGFHITKDLSLSTHTNSHKEGTTMTRPFRRLKRWALRWRGR